MLDEKEAVPEDIQVKLNFRVPSRMPSVYAHHLFIQPGPNEVVLSFFEVIPPIITEQIPEERLKIIQETGVIAECVARVTVANGTFAGFAKAMQQIADQVATPQKQDADNAEDHSEG